MPVISSAGTPLDAYAPVVAVKMTVTAGAVDSVSSKLNPFGSDFIILGAAVYSTTAASTGGALLDVGIAATAVASDILIDGLDINAATFPSGSTTFGIADSVTNAGSNGVNAGLWRADQYLTATAKAQASTAFVGFVYVWGYVT